MLLAALLQAVYLVAAARDVISVLRKARLDGARLSLARVLLRPLLLCHRHGLMERAGSAAPSPRLRWRPKSQNLLVGRVYKQYALHTSEQCGDVAVTKYHDKLCHSRATLVDNVNKQGRTQSALNVYSYVGWRSCALSHQVGYWQHTLSQAHKYTYT